MFGFNYRVKGTNIKGTPLWQSGAASLELEVWEALYRIMSADPRGLMEDSGYYIDINKEYSDNEGAKFVGSFYIWRETQTEPLKQPDSLSDSLSLLFRMDIGYDALYFEGPEKDIDIFYDQLIKNNFIVSGPGSGSDDVKLFTAGINLPVYEDCDYKYYVGIASVFQPSNDMYLEMFNAVREVIVRRLSTDSESK